MTPELLQRIAEAYRKSQTKDVTGLFLRLLLPQASDRRRVVESRLSPTASDGGK